MSKPDFYSLLGVDRSATADELKKAYRKLAMKWHPDKNPGDADAEKKFKEISEAYDVLKDEQSRAAYDQYGHAAFDGSMGGRPGGGFNGDFSSSMSDIFDDLFGEFTGGRRGQRSNGGRARGADLRYNMSITLEEAYEGKKAQIRVPSSVSCDTCAGSGATPGSKPINCNTCGGSGRVRAAQGFFSIERTCPSCHGRGQVIEDPCKSCHGQGRVQKERTLSVTIPQGVEEGTRIRLSGEGEAGMRGGPAGDLYIFLSVSPHKLFERDGTELFCSVPVSLTTAALGGEIEVPTLGGGKVKVKIPEGTQTGKQFRLRGKGMPGLHARRHGDLYIQIQVETPVGLTKKQKDLLKQFQEASSSDNSPESAGFFAKVKDFFNDAPE
ncbi:MAG: molecular chaperone DnaJ [Alphaproteobacteria bacterium]|nr:molecular chaperone DnaJ [Rhodobiaceae bacterium]MBO6543167.1 molecular chaperone DnaJ [Alphaproteobacteria bacterium]MBO6626906.1 molecular chaperone DnaJ [Alphaproteobacteria bacterium]MDF1627673.1 molecular chaperone DnaJ [Parvibaculaceae bacterium]